MKLRHNSDNSRISTPRMKMIPKYSNEREYLFIKLVRSFTQKYLTVNNINMCNHSFLPIDIVTFQLKMNAENLNLCNVISEFRTKTF